MSLDLEWTVVVLRIEIGGVNHRDDDRTLVDVDTTKRAGLVNHPCSGSG